MEYTVDYFIAKFKAIPDSLWITAKLENDGRKCAMGHCNVSVPLELTEEAMALYSLLNGLKVDYTRNSKPMTNIEFETIYFFNDGHIKQYQQDHPKKRILAALYDIKKMQESQIGKAEVPVPKEVIRYVSVPESIKEQKEELILN